MIDETNIKLDTTTKKINREEVKKAMAKAKTKEHVWESDTVKGKAKAKVAPKPKVAPKAKVAPKPKITLKATPKAPRVKKEKKPILVDDGTVNTHLDYDGTKENVPAVFFSNKIKCECGDIRWVKNADLFQVKKCKPCTMKERKARRSKNRSANRKAKKA